MSNFKKRVANIEHNKQSSGRLVVIAVNEGETNVEAYQRCFAKERIKPKTVIYASPMDVLL
jgi:hypothetical protein